MTVVDISTPLRAKSRLRPPKADRRMMWRGLMFAAPAGLLLLAIYIVPMFVLAGFPSRITGLGRSPPASLASAIS